VLKHLIWPVLLVVAQAAFADPPIPVDPDLAESATLRYQYTPETVSVYRVSVGQVFTMTGEGLDHPVTSSTRVAFDLTSTVLDVDEASVAMIQQTIGNLETTAELNGSQLPIENIASSLDGAVTTMYVTPLGSVVTAEAGDDTRADGVVQMTSQALSRMSIRFPEGELAVGDRWTQDVPYDLSQPGMDFETTSTAQYTYLGVALVDGVPCAVLQSDVRLTLTGTLTEGGMTATATGTGSGQGYSYFDNAAGSLLQGSLETTIEMEVSGVGMDVNQTMRLTVTVGRL
jgi:hypothetical protein